ncbi:MAG: hypothetical protein IJX90_00240 [Blautia sp.]|nr:hypothetical protein [Blautia sp.]
MSRFLKFIVHLVVICAIICVLGLTVPPFFGVQTVVVDDVNEMTNLPMGSVTYAIPKKTEDVYVGEPILVQEDTSTYRYEVQRLNLENGTGTVIDPTVTDSKQITVAVRDYVPKVLITIGYVGYLQTATKSVEGLIILGLAVLFLIILYVIAELWKKDKHRRDYEDDESAEYVKSKKELKKEEKERARRLKEEEQEIRREAKESKRRKKKGNGKVRTGGFVDEIDESDDEDEDDDIRLAVPDETPEMLDEAAEELEENEPEALPEEPADEEPAAEQEAEIGEDETLEEDEEPVIEDLEPDEEPEIAEIRKRAIPGYSAAQLADQAKEKGLSPDMVRDDITDVTLFDYSDILNELAKGDE